MTTQLQLSEKPMPLFAWSNEPVYPARRDDPTTTFQAAEEIGPHVNNIESKIVECLKTSGPQTSEEIASRLAISLVTISPRLRPLEIKNRVARDGTKRNVSGRFATLWKAI
jgi:predicted HTH transcriptional regulator